MPLLVALLATQLLVSAPLSRAADAPAPAYIELDGRRVLEIRVAAGAQTPAQLARLASQRLAELAANYSIEAEQIVLQEDPPYTTIGVMRDGKFEPRLSVDDRNAARFQLSRQQLAQRYLEQIRAAIVRYRQTHRRSDWLRGGAQAFSRAIPDLISVVVILALSVMLMRASNAWFRALELGDLRLSWFYPEWARPTARLVGIGILLLGVVLAYPYIPGADSKAFQGAGLFVGVLAALGSSAVAANLIGGLMLTYTRAYQEGDRVNINGTVGIVHDSALLVTRLRTPRNEVVSIPNATVLVSSIVNYSLASREITEPVVIATTVTIGYDVPWRQVHRLMLDAASATVGISQEILSPGYHAMRNGNGSTVPPWPSESFAPPG